ncbi:hypothetical protein BH18ACT6_BH18ACT6_13330 [soil metagenome]|nr:hypothetical protein [Actinomycetota bacterium]
MKSGLWPVGIVGGLIATCYVVLVMSGADWNPTVMLAEGVAAPAQLEYAERTLERPVATRAALGHDGKFFFILANDPWLLDPENHASFLDLPSYRSQRMLYPLLAGGFGLLTAIPTMWGLVVVNVIAAGLGSSATGGIARLLGASRWLGLVFVVSPGVIAELDISGAGTLALALALAGLWLLVKGRSAWAVTALTGAVLARETMILFAAGLCLWAWKARYSFRPALLGVPAAAAIGWRLYIGSRLSSIETTATTAEGLSRNFDLVPLRGVLDASAVWTQNQTKLLWVLCLVAMLALFARRAWRSLAGITWGAWPFALLSIFLSVVVWLEPFDIARAIAPIFIAYPLILFAKVPIEESKSK